jgi:phosphoenolpyruvate synthase/pyruvate phosphate dikinase
MSDQPDEIEAAFEDASAVVNRLMTLLLAAQKKAESESERARSDMRGLDSLIKHAAKKGSADAELMRDIAYFGNVDDAIEKILMRRGITAAYRQMATVRDILHQAACAAKYGA